jgi:MFS family permease
VSTATEADRSGARRAIALLLTGHVLSRTGNVVSVFALPFIVLEQGGGPIEVGVAAFSATVPILIGGPLGGAVVDRIGALRSSAIADAVSGATIALIPILALTVGLPFPALLALVFAGALLDAPGETARQVVLPQLAAAAGIRLERAVGFLDATTRLSGLLGGPLAGLLVALLGAADALVVTASAFGVSAVVTVVLARSRAGRAASVRAEQDAEADAGAGSGLLAGIRFLVREPVLRLIVGLVLVTNLLDAARSSSLLPLYATEQLGGAAGLGLVTGAFAGAAFLGSVGFGLIAHRVPRRPVFVLGFLLAGGPSLLAPALGADLPWMVAAGVVSGLAAGSLNPIIGAIELERTPPQVRGRVLGAITAGAWAGIPVGGLLGGVGAAAIGVSASFAVILAAYTVAALLPLTRRTWRGMERPAPASGDGPRPGS